MIATLRLIVRFWQEMSWLVHELAHTMAELTIQSRDPEFSTKREVASARAMEAGLWRDTLVRPGTRPFQIGRRPAARDSYPPFGPLLAQWS